jgi:hypothetical protein
MIAFIAAIFVAAFAEHIVTAKWFTKCVLKN